MNILYIGYWNLDDPLTTATIFPNLKILQEMHHVGKIVFVNVQRNAAAREFKPGFEASKIEHQQLMAANTPVDLLNRIVDFIRFPRKLRKIVLEHEVDVIIARGALAGTLALLTSKGVRLPFVVESFEPHADYMLESGVWNRFDPRYIFQKRWESRQLMYAFGIMTVTENYSKKLLSLKSPESTAKILSVPCAVDLESFAFSESERDRLKSLYDFGNAVVGVYAGRFGGLYLSSESFQLYKAAFDFFQDFYLILLTPKEHHDFIHQQLKAHQLPAQRVIVKSASHKEVQSYLSAADFAFATYKPGRSKAYLSPVKIGEYWANGLPVILTSGVGDDTEIIRKHPNAGVLLDVMRIKQDQYIGELFSSVKDILRSPVHREENRLIAKKFRTFDNVRSAYLNFLESIR